MIALYLVRHSETVANVEGWIQGHLDSPLTTKGTRQAEIVARRLASERFDAVYSSDLGRARSSAEIIARQLNLPVRASDLLRERCFGCLQGLTRAQVEERFPTGSNEWRRDPEAMRPPGGENREDLIGRCAEFLRGIVESHAPGERLVVVGHGGSVKAILCAALGLDSRFISRLHLSNASLSVLDAGDRPSLWLYNDTCHLDSMHGEDEGADDA